MTIRNHGEGGRGEVLGRLVYFEGVRSHAFFQKKRGHLVVLVSIRPEYLSCGVWLRPTRESESYFAKPDHSWERGLNENTNGLTGQYFLKGMNLREVSREKTATDGLQILSLIRMLAFRILQKAGWGVYPQPAFSAEHV